MFSALQKGDYFYILRKTNDGPVLEIGQIENISTVRPNFGSYPINGLGNIDIYVRVGTETYKFPQIPSNVDYFNHEKDNVIITESRDKMMATISALGETSEQALKDRPYHEKVVASIQDMRAKLDPEIAKDNARDKEITAMKEQISQLQQGFSNISSGVTELLGIVKGNAKSN